jgi:hypothetical protein
MQRYVTPCSFVCCNPKIRVTYSGFSDVMYCLNTCMLLEVVK